MVSYLRTLPRPKLLLWCYLIWYAYFAVRLFDPSPSLWFNSLGLSFLIGTALYVSTAYAASNGAQTAGHPRNSATRAPVERWVVFRCYLMPLCVSSFAALIKGKGFVLVFSPQLRDNLIALTLCGSFVAAAEMAKRHARGPGPLSASPEPPPTDTGGPP